MTATRVIVTRPVREAGRWLDELQTAGLDAVALPLIEIGEALDVAPLRAAWQSQHRYAAVMCVSAAAVEGFFKQKEAVAPVASAPTAIDLIANARWWVTGPGTARALQAAGVPDAQIDQPAPGTTRLDSEALWQQVHAQLQPGARVLIVRGGDATGEAAGRNWLADEIDAAGALRDTVVAYRRLMPVLSEAQCTLAAQSAAGGAVWLFSSSEAIRNLQRALPAVRWSAARAVATHPRIAQAAQDAGFGTVRFAPPNRDALVASIESLA